MQVDFYQLAGDAAEQVAAKLAAKVVETGEKLLIVAGDSALLDAIDRSLWEAEPASFLPHGRAGDANAKRQPVLLADTLQPDCDAAFVMLADGRWREEAVSYARALYLFAPDRIDEARAAWRDLSNRESVEPRFWKQEHGRWRQGP